MLESVLKAAIDLAKKEVETIQKKHVLAFLKLMIKTLEPFLDHRFHA